MADGVRRFEYDLVIDHVCMIGQWFNGEFDPKKCNPYRELGEPQAGDTPEGRERESERGWGLLGKALSMLKRKKSPKKKSTESK